MPLPIRHTRSTQTAALQQILEQYKQTGEVCGVKPENDAQAYRLAVGAANRTARGVRYGGNTVYVRKSLMGR